MAEGSKVAYGAAEILKMLPHRFPFLLIDKVLEVERGGDGSSKVGWKIRAIKCVTINEPFFPGHFPHRPVMPGVLQIEAMAQVAAIGCVVPGGPKMDVAIAGINQARFRRPVVPGDVMLINSEVLKDRNGLLIIKCEAHVDGELVCEAEIIAKMFPMVES